MKTIQRTMALTLGAALWACALPAAPGKLTYAQLMAREEARFEATWPKSAPHKLSDLHQFFAQNVAAGLGTDLKARSVRILGRSWKLIADAHFPRVELVLEPFQAQGLRFTKGGFVFRDLDLDKEALKHWKLKLTRVREVQSRLVFTLRSLAERLSKEDGGQVGVQADMDGQRLTLTGPGAFCGIACTVETECGFVWNGDAKTLSLVPQVRRFAGHVVPRWLWGLGRGPDPREPILDFGFSWIPFNIQQVHVGWDEVDISTDW